MVHNDETKRRLEDLRKQREENVKAKAATERGYIPANHIGSIGPKTDAEWIAQINVKITELDEEIAMLESSANC